MSDRLSKRMAYVLRHRPDTLNLVLDDEGWTDLDALVTGLGVTEAAVLKIVANDAKQRYAVKDGRIRANQGHSALAIQGLQQEIPPDILYHGTTHERWEQIQQTGLDKMRRHHVHLSADEATARQVGSRHRGEKLLVLKIDAAAMVRDNHPFWLSENGVWLAECVPTLYIQGPRSLTEYLATLKPLDEDVPEIEDLPPDPVDL